MSAVTLTLWIAVAVLALLMLRAYLKVTKARRVVDKRPRA